MDCRFPKITQDGCDGSETQGFIANLWEQVTVTTRGLGSGVIELLTAWDGKPVGEIPVTSSNEWKNHKADLTIPHGVHALYFRYRGKRNISFHSFTLKGSSPLTKHAALSYTADSTT